MTFTTSIFCSSQEITEVIAGAKAQKMKED